MRRARPLDDGGLADAGLTDQDGVVLGAAGKDLNGATDFLVPADDRVDLAVGSGHRQVAGIAFQRVIAVFGGSGVRRLALAQFIDGAVQRVRFHTGSRQNGLGNAALAGQTLQQTLGRDELVTRLLGGLFGGAEDPGGIAIHIELA